MNTLPNIVLICIDALRHDCISAEREKPLLEKYGVAGKVHTPTIDSIAQGGVRFRRAISSAIHTPPSLTSIFTGLYPPHNGVQAFFKTELSPEIFTLAELLSRSGYQCIHATEFPYIKFIGLERGIHQSFKTEEERLFDHIKEQRRPLYLFLHFFDVHDPYLCSPPMGFKYNRDYRETFTALTQRFNIPAKDEPFPYVRTFQALIQLLFDKGELSTIFSLYIDGVNKFDQRRFSEYLKKLENTGIFENCLLFLFSDHGEGPGKETFGHGNELYDGMIRAPLVVSYPGMIPENTASETQVRLIDIMPTILDALGQKGVNISLPYPLDGKSLLPVIEGTDQDSRPAYSEVWHHSLSADEMGKFLDQCLENQNLLTPSYDTYLHQRSYRNLPWKIILEGDKVAAMDISLSKTEDEFVRMLFTSLFHRKPMQEETENYKLFIKRHPAGSNSLLSELIRQNEFVKKNALYNTAADPSEHNNHLSAHVDDEMLQIYLRMKNSADQIFLRDKRTAQKPIVYASSEEQSTIENRLRALGYLE